MNDDERKELVKKYTTIQDFQPKVSATSGEIKNLCQRRMQETMQELRLLIEKDESFSQEEKDILTYRFGITTGTPKTAEETAKKFDVSEDKVRQLQARLARKDGDNGSVVRHLKLKGFLD